MPIGTIEVPLTHVTDEPTICIPVNVDWIPAVLAMVSPARYPEFWAGTLSENRRARLEVQNLIYLISNGGFCGMTTCCIPPYIIKRVDPATGMIQISPDNGATWQPAPNGLPTVIVEPVPPVTSGVAGSKCDAAQNVETQFEDWITHVTNDFDTAVDIFAFATAVILAITEAILLILSEGALTLIETEISTAIGTALTGVWLAGKTVFSGYWTDAVKKQLLCITLAHIGDDGSFTDATFSDLWNDFNLHLPGGIAKTLFMGFLSSIGRQGVNAMSSSGRSSISDCSECAGGCDASLTWVIAPPADGTNGVITSSGRTSSNLAVTGTVAGGDSRYYMQLVAPDDTSCCTLANLSIGGSPSDRLIAWNLCGETPGTWTHSGSISDVVGQSIVALMVRNIDPSSMTLTF